MAKKEKLPRTLEKVNYQTGKSAIEIDMPRYALEPGKRLSKNKKTYWEMRKNRSDKTGKNV